jgi:hypothetical protein
MTIETTVARYLDQIVPPAGRPAAMAADLTWPLGGRPKDAVLAALLADPTRLAGYGSAASVQRKYERLLSLAYCLESIELPAELASRAARLRFLAWSLRFRIPEQHRDELVPEQIEGPDGGTVVVAYLMVQAARTARADWLKALATYEDDRWLMHRHATSPVRFEHDLVLVTRTWPADWRDTGTPLRLAESATTDADERQDRPESADLAEQHWLPRGSLAGAASAFAPAGPWTRLIPWALPAMSLVVLILFLAGLVDTASIAALTVPAAGFAAAILLPTRQDALLLLRVPAAALVGAVVLVSLTARWWLDPDAWQLGLGLLVVSAGYLMVEARLHGSTRAAACRRGLVVTAVGTLFAFVAGLLVLRFVEPVVGENGACLLNWWRTSPWQVRPLTAGCAATEGTRSAAASSGAVLLITGWSLAVGLAAQILWDDRPVTAPLGRLRRVRGGSQ